MKKYVWMLCMLVLAGCGKSLDGAYVLDGGFASASLIFKSGGKVVQSTMGMETELNYKIEDNKIRVSNDQGANMLLTLLPDGSIQGPLGMKYIKQK